LWWGALSSLKDKYKNIDLHKWIYADPQASAVLNDRDYEQDFLSICKTEWDNLVTKNKAVVEDDEILSEDGSDEK